ncbi:MAG: bifunctional ADP-heptose synthase [Vampirovibrionales bacterium]|nr:bifunctional ADP-heptose synthase [Vampirovibrionales bacterium]
MAMRFSELHFKPARFAVIGDVVIDEMIYGDTARLSREAPVVILKHTRTNVVLGGAGNAAHNLAKLGANTCVLSVCGDDYNATRLRAALARDGVNADNLVADASRPTPTKTRISGTANHSVTQQIVRIDAESHVPIETEIEQRLIDALTRLAPDLDAILLSDYGMGVITPRVIEACRRLSQQYNLIWTVDSQRALSPFAGATLVTPNQPEAEQNLGYALTTDEAVLHGGADLLQQVGCQHVLITLGQRGMALFSQHESAPLMLPAFNKSDVFDVTGAGDTVIATVSLALASGYTPNQAVTLGNLAASLVVKQFGAATTTLQALNDAMQALPAVAQGTV